MHRTRFRGSGFSRLVISRTPELTYHQSTGGAQNIKLKPKDKKASDDASSDKVKGKGAFRGFRGFM
jgi:hypothetical protein